MTIRRDLVLASMVTAAVGVVLVLGWTQPVERPVADLFLRLAHTWSSADSPVAAVVIDDRAIKMCGSMPWPRQTLASLVSRIAECGPRALVIDMLLSEPRDEEGDSMLEQSLHDVDAVLTAVLSPEGGWLLPLERFGGAGVAAHGHAETDTDGVVRSIAVTKQATGLALPALSIAAARHGGWNGPIMPGRRVRPDFRQAPQEILRLSAADLLDASEVGSRVLTDRVVFLGYSASATSDQYLVPVSDRNRPAPGVLVHAAVTSSVIRGGLLRPLQLWTALGLVLLVAAATQLLRSRSGRLRVAHMCVVASTVVLVTTGALWTGGLLLPTVSLLLAAALSTGLREAVESKQAQTETGTVLASLIEEEGLDQAATVPRGVHGRLAMVKSLQGRLARDRNLRRALLEGMNEGVVLWDGLGNPLLSNGALSSLWGHPPTLQEVQDALAGPAGGSGPSARVEVQRGRRNLEVEILEVAGGRLGLIRDVTERSELDRRRREMHRLVSHELKTPLASISGFGEMLQTYEMSGMELRNVAGMIRAEADRLGEMVRAFLDIERLGSDHWEAERGELDLAAVVESRTQVLTSAASARGQVINVKTGTAAMISGVEQLISQLVDNLVGNALKYSPDGGEVSVEVSTNNDGEVALKVRDHGAGIPRDAIPHLYERFYRVPGTRAQGSGLGLALVKEVADWHGATIHVESGVGQGSCFTVVFPVCGACG